VKTRILEKVQFYGVGVFKKWAALRKIGEDMETYEVQEVDKFTINLGINFALYD
jgi:hypothetical protein